MGTLEKHAFSPILEEKPSKNVKNLTDSELLQMVSGLHDVAINEEWVRRHGINMPYRLNIYGKIINCMSLQVMDDRECDRLIVEQANEVRTLNQLS